MSELRKQEGWVLCTHAAKGVAHHTIPARLRCLDSNFENLRVFVDEAEEFQCCACGMVAALLPGANGLGRRIQESGENGLAHSKFLAPQRRDLPRRHRPGRFRDIHFSHAERSAVPKGLDSFGHRIPHAVREFILFRHTSPAHSCHLVLSKRTIQ